MLYDYNMNKTNWRAVQLPKILVDKIENLTKNPQSNYRNISDYISTLIRKELEATKK
jgi:hypothetical protein